MVVTFYGSVVREVMAGYEQWGPVTGNCLHACRHNETTVAGYGLGGDRAELVQCDGDCRGLCRAWAAEGGRVTTAWFQAQLSGSVAQHWGGPAR